MSVRITSANLRSIVIGVAGGAVPTITSFSPTSGAVADSVTITGTNLLGTTDVKINGVSSGSLSNITSTSVTAVVPSGATTGIITVVTPAGTADTSALSPSTYTVNPSSNPTFTVTTSPPFAYSYSDPSGPPFSQGLGGGLYTGAIPTNGTQPTSLKAQYTSGNGTMRGDTYTQGDSWLTEFLIGPSVSGSALLIGMSSQDDTFNPNIQAGSISAPWFASDGSGFADSIYAPPGTYPTWAEGDIIAIGMDFNSSLLVGFKNGVQFFDQGLRYIIAHNTTYTCGTFLPYPRFTIGGFEFVSYSGPQFTVQEYPNYAPAYPSLPYTWDPTNDIQFILQPGENITVNLIMTGYTGAVTGTSYTTDDGIYQITAVGQTGNSYQFTVSNIESGISTVPEPLTFTVTDSVGAIGTYTVTVNDIFT